MSKAQQAQSYIENLAKKLNTKMVQKPHLHGMMYVEFEPPVIEGPLVDQPNCFRYVNMQCRVLSLLHELGHVALGHTQGRPPFVDKKFYFDNGVLKSEAQAWEFALNEYDRMAFLDPINTDTRFYMWEKCMGSYYRVAMKNKGKPYRLRNGDRGHVEFIFDEPDEYFWKIKDRMSKTSP